MSLPECQTLQLQQQGIALHITLNRPQARNAMSLAMVEELQSVFTALQSMPAIRVVTLRGRDGHFCAGGDIKDMAAARNREGRGEADPYYRLNRAFGDLLLQVEASPQVVVGLLEGTVLGGGFGLACVSDIAIAQRQCRFGLPETSLGVIPAQIAPFVVKRIGLTQTRRIALMGLRFDGDEALNLGLVHEVADDGQALLDAAERVIDQVRRCAPGANARTKALLLRVGNEPMEQLLDDAALMFAEAVRGDEGSEGTLAFIQKRAPRWAQ